MKLYKSAPPKIGAKRLANALKTKAKHKSLSKSCKMVPLFCLFVQIAALSIKANATNAEKSSGHRIWNHYLKAMAFFMLEKR